MKANSMKEILRLFKMQAIKKESNKEEENKQANISLNQNNNIQVSESSKSKNIIKVSLNNAKVWYDIIFVNDYQ